MKQKVQFIKYGAAQHYVKFYMPPRSISSINKFFGLEFDDNAFLRIDNRNGQSVDIDNSNTSGNHTTLRL